MKYPITCRQTGARFDNGDTMITAPVFAVRNATDGPIEVIRADTPGSYAIAAGKLNDIVKLFYLILEEVTSEDNNKQFVCVDENESRIKAKLEEAYSGYSTTIKVEVSSESKFSFLM